MWLAPFAHGALGEEKPLGFFLPGYGGGGELLWSASGSDAETIQKPQKMLLHGPLVNLFSGGVCALAFESPSAEFDGSCMVGDDIVHVVGVGFTAVGSRWTFSGTEKKLRIDGSVQVFFEAEQSTAVPQSGGNGQFTATAGGLLIEGGDGVFTLIFSGPIALRAQNYLLRCDELRVEVPLGCAEKIFGKELPREQFRAIFATGNVRMDDPERSVAADEVRIFHSEDGALIFSGNVTITDGSGEIRGQRVLIRGDRHCVLAGGDGPDGNPMLDLD